MREFFYARVSSKSQNLDRQIETAYNLKIPEGYIFVEKASGKDFQRPEYQLLKRLLQKNDTLYIQSLDRLGRNKQMIMEEWTELTKVKKVKIIVTDMPLLDTRKYNNSSIENLISDIILELLAYMAEDERIRTKERQRQGIEIAKKNNVKFGRKKIKRPNNFSTIYYEWKNRNLTATKAMEILGLKRNTFYSLAREYEKEKGNVK